MRFPSLPRRIGSSLALSTVIACAACSSSGDTGGAGGSSSGGTSSGGTSSGGTSSGGTSSGGGAGSAGLSSGGTSNGGASSGGAAGSGGSTGDEPAYDANTSTLVFSDDMDEYTTIDAMQAYSGSDMAWKNIFGGDSANQVLSPGRGGSGHALRQVYAGTDQESHTLDLINAPYLPDTTTHFVQYWARVTIDPPGIAATVLAVKWIMLFHPSGGRIQFNTHDHLPCTLDHPGGYTTWQVYDTLETSCQANQPVGPYPVDVFDGQWHRFTYEYRPNTNAGSNDGIARMWVDGTKVIDISASAVDVTPPGGYKTWCSSDDLAALASEGINLIRWTGNLTTTTSPFTVDMDDFRWWTPK